MTKMKKILLSVAAVFVFAAPLAKPASAQVVVRVGPHHRYYHHHYHHRYYRH